MSDVPEPEKRMWITVAGQEWRLYEPGRFDFPEARELKRVTGGMNLIEVEKGFNGLDPDAWFGVLFVSLRRSWPTLTEQELQDAVGSTPLVELAQSIRTEGVEGPPTLAAEPATSGSSGFGGTTPELSTPGTSGDPS